MRDMRVCSPTAESQSGPGIFPGLNPVWLGLALCTEFQTPPPPPQFPIPSVPFSGVNHSGVPRGGGQGGPWPPGASLGGAPAQLVGPNCKKKIRPRQISKVTSLQSAVADAGFTKRRGGGAPRAPTAPAV